MIGKHSRYRVKSSKEYYYVDDKVYFDLTKKIDYIDDIEKKGFTKINDFNPYKIESKSGVYIFSLKNNTNSDVAYIGSAIDLSKRLYSHDVLRMLTYAIHNSLKLDIFILYCNNYKNIESKMISIFNPFLNVNYSSYESRTITYFVPKGKRRNKINEALGTNY